MLKAYKYRLYLTPEQEELFKIQSDGARFVYNLALETKIQSYLGSKKNLTFFDILRLTIAAHRTTQDDEQIVIKGNQYNNDNNLKSLFVDDEISLENISIQVINASSISGLGKRLETDLSRLGANVISVNTSQKKVATSSIQYFGEKTYTSKKLENILKFVTKKLTEKQIADIVIVIGEDSKNY